MVADRKCTKKIRYNQIFTKKIINMAIKRTVIQVPRGAVQNICQSQGCEKSAVYAALNFTSFSESAARIRQLALSDYGGIKTTKTYFD